MITAIDEVLGTKPAETVMLARKEFGPVRNTRCKIDEGDVAVFAVGAVNVHVRGGRDGLHAGMRDRRRRLKQTDLKTALLADFPEKCLFGILVELDVAADRQPLVVGLVMDQEHPAFMNDENGNDEVKQVMDVRHVEGAPDAE